MRNLKRRGISALFASGRLEKASSTDTKKRFKSGLSPENLVTCVKICFLKLFWSYAILLFSFFVMIGFSSLIGVELEHGASGKSSVLYSIVIELFESLNVGFKMPSSVLVDFDFSSPLMSPANS